MDTTFYLLWRNWYIRSQIRNIICKHLVININSLKELQDNHQYLSVFTDRDKLDNKIFIRLKIQDREDFNQYVGSECRFVINDLELHSCRIRLDCDRVPHGVQRLSCMVDQGTGGSGETIGGYPSSLTELIVQTRQNNRHRSFSNELLDSVLCHLPPSLKKLTLPFEYDISTKVELPATLEDLHYKTSVSNAKKMVVPVNKVFVNFEVYIPTSRDLQWVHGQTWIGKIMLDRLAEDTITVGMIPSHIKDLNIRVDLEVDDGAFPEGLNVLHYKSYLPISRLFLPQQLVYLYIEKFSQPLPRDALPPTLETLEINIYDCALLPGVLPPRLKRLQLKWFQRHKLELDVLPLSLTDLTLDTFNHELKPFVLPPRLKILNLNTFSGSIKPNSLPSTLTHLHLPQFKGSLEHAPLMPQLSFLHLKELHSSVSPHFLNNTNIHNTIKIIGSSIDQEFNIHESPITSRINSIFK